MYQFREHAVAGGLMSYGIDLPDVYRQAGVLHRKEFGIANRVLDILVPEIGLQSSRIVAGIG